MNKSSKNIVELSYILSDADSAFIIKIEEGKFSSVLAISGILRPDENILQKFLRDTIVLKVNKTEELSKLETFGDLLEKKNFKSFFINEIKFKYNSEDKFFLILLSYSEKAFEKDTIKKIFRSIKAIKKYEDQTTIKKIAKENLKLREEIGNLKLQKYLLVKSASEFMFTLDRFGCFLIINEAVTKALGYSEKKIIGKHFLDFIAEEKKADIAIEFQKILSLKEAIQFETILLDRYGKKLNYKINAQSLRKDEKVIGMLGSAQNVSEKQKEETKIKELNAKLVEANRLISIERDRAQEQISVLEELNRLKNDFISNVSHELRTPLASIVGFAETISSDEDLPREMIYEFNKIMLDEGKRLAKFINDILDFSKIESGTGLLNKEKFDLVASIKESISVYKKLSEKKSVIINQEIPEAEIIINADKERIMKALYNVVDNAVKFTPANGRVTIQLKDFLNEVEIVVSDTGVGISAKDVPNLFTKFSKVNRERTQIPGAGFGLAVVKQIIDMHKGLIRAKSEINKGTAIIIKLPKES